MKKIRFLALLAFTLAPLAGCVVAPAGPGPYSHGHWVPGHYGAYGGWHPGHWG